MSDKTPKSPSKPTAKNNKRSVGKRVSFELTDDDIARVNAYRVRIGEQIGLDVSFSQAARAMFRRALEDEK